MWYYQMIEHHETVSPSPFGACLPFPMIWQALARCWWLSRWPALQPEIAPWWDCFGFLLVIHHGSLNVPIEHHPTIRYMVYNGYYKVMSNSPKNGHLPIPVHRVEEILHHQKDGLKSYISNGINHRFQLVQDFLHPQYTVWCDSWYSFKDINENSS